MLPSLQFTEYHKFLVSVGGLSVGLAAALPIFLLRTQKVPTIKAEDIGKLDPASQKALALQQEQTLWLLKVWPIISALLLVVGLVLVWRGATIWRKRQRVLNSREDAEIKRIAAEESKLTQEAASFMRAHQLSPDEQARVAEEKIEEDGELLAVPVGSELQEAEPSAVPHPRPASNVDASWTESLEIPADAPSNVRGLLTYLVNQNRLLDRLARPFQGQVDVARGVRLGRAEMDAVFTSSHPQLPSLVVEVKTLRSAGAKQSAWSGILAADEAKATAEREVKREFRPVVVYLLPDTDTDSKRFYVAIGEALRQRAIISTSPLTVIAVQARDILRLSVDPSWLQTDTPYFHWQE
ncbi:hypothetical protein ACIBTZ_27215 [Micromonospora sp. NPDC049460]|uniref:hypothetical protein n=1 Tax=Micromonospora sp. NPDC049460 TaxID=3364272 RepID=UPI0037AB2BA7